MAEEKRKKSSIVKRKIKTESVLVKDEEVGPEIALEKIGKDGYLQTVGRRKTSTARIRLYIKGDKRVTINEKDYREYFTTSDLQETSISPLKKMKYDGKVKIVARVTGGGINSQAEAVRHGISRALVELNPEFRKRLRSAGFLTRDPRKRERKKFGLKRARRAPQWGKR